MGAFSFKTDQKSEVFCMSIAREMVAAFGISQSEAIRRISHFWGQLTEIIGENDLVYHEDERYWARTVYYGAGSFWWITGDERERRNLPPLMPQPPRES
jgi:hypothetical protein